MQKNKYNQLDCKRLKMRDYLYIYNNNDEKYILTSGINFKDLQDVLTVKNGLILIKHCYHSAHYDNDSRFDYILSYEINNLIEDDIYSYGDFIFVDYDNELKNLSKQDISELLYFGHKVEPYGNINIKNIDNEILCYIHDDGYLCKIYYSNWEIIDKILASLLNENNISSLIKNKNIAYWFDKDGSKVESSTDSIDDILNRNIKTVVSPKKELTFTQKIKKLFRYI